MHFIVAGFALFVVYALLHPERFAAITSFTVAHSITLGLATLDKQFEAQP